MANNGRMDWTERVCSAKRKSGRGYKGQRGREKTGVSLCATRSLRREEVGGGRRSSTSYRRRLPRFTALASFTRARVPRFTACLPLLLHFKQLPATMDETMSGKCLSLPGIHANPLASSHILFFSAPQLPAIIHSRPALALPLARHHRIRHSSSPSPELLRVPGPSSHLGSRTSPLALQYKLDRLSRQQTIGRAN